MVVTLIQMQITTFIVVKIRLHSDVWHQIAVYKTKRAVIIMTCDMCLRLADATTVLCQDSMSSCLP